MVDNAHNDEVAPQLSPPQRPLCIAGRLGRKKKKVRGARWKGKREKKASAISCAVLWQDLWPVCGFGLTRQLFGRF